MKCCNSGHVWIYVAVLLSTRINAKSVIGRDVDVAVGDDAELFCQLANSTEKLTSVTWQRRTKERPGNADFFVIASDGKEEHMNGLKERVKFTGNIVGLLGSIRLSSVTVSDEGIYTCVFSLFPSGPVEGEVRLKVLIPAVVSVVTDVPPVAGDTEAVLATCTAASAKPAAEVSWSLGALSDSVKVQNNTTVDSEGRFTVTSRLIGAASKDLNQQKVRCLVSHPGLKKNLELDHRLIIHYPPQAVYISLVSDKGEPNEFQCEVDANPKPNFTWGRHFPVKEPLSTGVANRLIIQRTPGSNGLSYCVVSNQYGTAVGSLYVDVIPPTDCTTCWTLFIILILLALVVFGVFVSRKSHFIEGFQHFIERLRRDPVAT